jgi:hypothetical protein
VTITRTTPLDELHHQHQATAQEFADAIADDLRQSVAAIVRAGEHLIAAKESLPHGEWLTMFTGSERAVERPLPFKARWAQVLMRIARHPILSNAHYGARLPAAVKTLYTLAALPDETLRKAIDTGRIHPVMEQRDAEALAVPPAMAPPRRQPRRHRDSKPSGAPSCISSTPPRCTPSARRPRGRISCSA